MVRNPRSGLWPSPDDQKARRGSTPTPGGNAGGEGAIAVNLPYRTPSRDSSRRLPMHQPRNLTR
jgi:hypothetical protein